MKEKPLSYLFEDIYPLIGKLVRISHLNNIPSSIGRLSIVDPESLAIVLAVEIGIRIVISSSVLAIEEFDTTLSALKLHEHSLNLIDENFKLICEEKSKLDAKTEVANFDSETLLKNKKRVLETLKKVHLVFTEDSNSGVLTVLNCVQIHKPYTASSCYSANELILTRVKKLLQSLES